MFYLLAPTLVIVPMSFTEARILSFPPEGFSLQWYERMFTDPPVVVGDGQQRRGRGPDRDPGDRPRDARGPGPDARPVPGQDAGQRARPRAADRARRDHRDRDVLRCSYDGGSAGSLVGLVIAHTALALPFVVVSVGGQPADDGPQSRARGGQPRGRPARGRSPGSRCRSSCLACSPGRSSRSSRRGTRSSWRSS